MTHIRGPWLTVLAWLFVLCIVGACSDDGGWTPTEPEPEPEAGSRVEFAYALSPVSQQAVDEAEAWDGAQDLRRAHEPHHA